MLHYNIEGQESYTSGDDLASFADKHLAIQ